MARANNHEDNYEGVVCDAVVRVLEERAILSRSCVECPEHDGGPGGVDLIFWLGSEKYALEHTRIEPFSNQIQNDAHFSEFIAPVMEQLRNTMPKPSVYELLFPPETHFNVSANQLEKRRTSLIQWIQETAHHFHVNSPSRLSRDECPHGFMEKESGRPEGFPFDVTIVRRVHWAESDNRDGALYPTRIVSSDFEMCRRARLQNAFDRKRKKLNYRKKEGATAVLVMENRDVFLSNHVLIGEHIAELLPERPEWLDQLFLIDTTTSLYVLHEWHWVESRWRDDYKSFVTDSLDNIFDM